MKKIVYGTLAAGLLTVAALTGCGPKYDVTITVYNWEDYIAKGTDDYGNETDQESTIDAFEKYYKEKYGKSIKVNYETFSTCEEMYTKIKRNIIKVDLCCPSDYMIQKMQSEDMLESFGFDYTEKKYTEGLDNYNDYLSPYIRDLFVTNEFADYAVPYFWGTMGYTYNSDLVTAEQVSTWDFQWNPGKDLNGNDLKKKITIKDSVRDSYFTAVMHVYKSELNTLKGQYESGLLTSAQYNASLTEIFNRHDSTTINLCKTALNELRNNVSLEVDEGKSDIVLGNIYVNLAWSGDSVFAMDEGDNAGKNLCYSVPTEGSNVWFDGWCMPKGAKVEAAKEFLNFLGNPEIAKNNMDAVGYTSPIAGQEMWDLVNEWYSLDAYEEGEYTEADCDEVDLSYFFAGTLDDGVEAKILVPQDERGRQFDAQYPDAETIVRCGIMKDFGAEGNTAVRAMWDAFTASIAF